MLKNKPFIAAALGCILPISAFAYDHDGTLQDTVTLRLDAAGLDTLRLDVGAGATYVAGDSRSNEIVVEAKIYQDKAADNYELSLDRRSSSEALLVTEIDSGGGLFWNNDTWIDLTVTVPASLYLDIDDSSGSIEVRDLDGDLRIDDSSGSIKVNNIVGNVDIDDSSGSIFAADIGGDVRIEDGSGSITVRNAGGTVTVDDGSGSIDVDGAANFVLIDDGSGSVDVDNVSGDIDMGP